VRRGVWQDVTYVKGSSLDLLLSRLSLSSFSLSLSSPLLSPLPLLTSQAKIASPVRAENALRAGVTHHTAILFRAAHLPNTRDTLSCRSLALSTHSTSDAGDRAETGVGIAQEARVAVNGCASGSGGRRSGNGDRSDRRNELERVRLLFTPLSVFLSLSFSLSLSLSLSLCIRSRGRSDGRCLSDRGLTSLIDTDVERDLCDSLLGCSLPRDNNGVSGVVRRLLKAEETTLGHLHPCARRENRVR
jgi:hypothetical protein